MRVSKVALYTLAVLTAYELNPKANASPISPIPIKEIETNNFMVPDETLKPLLAMSVAPSEMLMVQSLHSGELHQHYLTNTAVSFGKFGNTLARPESIIESAVSEKPAELVPRLNSLIVASNPYLDQAGLIPVPSVRVATRSVGRENISPMRAEAELEKKTGKYWVSNRSAGANSDIEIRTAIASLQKVGSKALAEPQLSQLPPPIQVATAIQLSADSPLNYTRQLSEDRKNPQRTADVRQSDPSPQKQLTESTVAQSTTPRRTTPSREEIDRLRNQLEGVEKTVKVEEIVRGSPALTIVTPHGFGLDDNTGFISASFQGRTRYTETSDGGLGIGIGLGNARKAVGVELSYTFASFGRSRDFGSGGFNAKVHRRLSEDTSVAIGWNGFLNIGDDNDFENSIYGSATKIFRLRDDINKPFSRIALTGGIGNGQFRSEDDVEDEDGTINVFGSLALRVARPVSVIAEWTGQDLGVGVSIAPFKNVPFVITPALRDITGAGDGTRFVLGAGLGFKF